MIQRIISQFILIAAWILVSIILTHVFIHQVSTFYNLLNASVLLFIFLGSTVLVNYKIEKNPKRFIGNFLVMTTLQLPLQHNVKARGSGRRQHRYRSPKTVVSGHGARSTELDRIGVHREAEIATEH